MKLKSTILVGAAIAALSAFTAQAADTIKIAFIDPLSGPFAATGTSGYKQAQFAADMLVNQKGGVVGGQMFEVVGFDNKISPKESLVQLKRAIGDGIHYIMQGNSSGVANALTDAVKKHNSRNPDELVLFMNYSAVDPALTNEKCNFWHFRFDANANIKMNALTDVIAEDESIKKVYIIGQDYSFGKAVAAGAVKYLGEKRPDIEIVGNELHPIGKVKDFTPYATKIRASEADAIITGNWGADMVGLAKAIGDAGIDAPVYTYYAANDGITKTIGASGKNKIRLVHEGRVNPPPTEEYKTYHMAFKEKYPEADISQFRIANALVMLANAMNETDSTDPAKVAMALEGMEYTTIQGDKVVMRAEDHQLMQPISISVHTDENIVLDADNSGYGLVTEKTISAADADIPPSGCSMERPAS
ncbi:branched-chain amino acid ABC transporter substrate-binding protein [Sneathiella sp. HT1-7]|uniref:branched-chain amino acid ABC transporter substrate-binding protein n=1 Tax=Sneathiella sp. HT1-7 TaxID=2887192 RepID=UPI001D15D2C3|nr:branched-chain amino acid ABC transporter substrate-binding protein [Sneathiella sp. HT1-7]MCC3305382.1 branched-chain amino acid ABC transporter substrate-binding protein [Sneathiella sp. HT1-7]